MIKQTKIKALFVAGLMLIAGTGYTVTAYAATQNSIDSTASNVGDFNGTLSGLTDNAENAKKLNEKISLPGNKEFIPGIKYSEKDHHMEDVDLTPEPKATPVVNQVETPAEQPAQQQVTQAATQAPEQTTQPAQTTHSVGTFKISFYDPAVLGSNMGYGGVATNLGVIPRGSRLKITTAQGDVWYRTVNDTGTFAASNPYQIDVAMPNNMIPSYGITSATVEIV